MVVQPNNLIEIILKILLGVFKILMMEYCRSLRKVRGMGFWGIGGAMGQKTTPKGEKTIGVNVIRGGAQLTIV